MANPFSTQLEINANKERNQQTLNQIQNNTIAQVGSAVDNTAKVIANGIGATTKGQISLDTPGLTAQINQDAQKIIDDPTIPEEDKTRAYNEMVERNINSFLSNKGNVYKNIFNGQYKNGLIGECQANWETGITTHLNTKMDKQFQDTYNAAVKGEITPEQSEQMVNNFEFQMAEYENGELVVVTKRYDENMYDLFMPENFDENDAVMAEFKKTCLDPIYAAKILQVGEAKAAEWMKDNYQTIADDYYGNAVVSEIEGYLDAHTGRNAYNDVLYEFAVSSSSINPLTGKPISNATETNQSVQNKVIEIKQRRAKEAYDTMNSTVLPALFGSEEDGINANPFMTSEELIGLLGGEQQTEAFLRDLDNYEYDNGTDLKTGSLIAQIVYNNDQNLSYKQFEATQDVRVLVGNTEGVMRLYAMGSSNAAGLSDIYNYQIAGAAQSKTEREAQDAKAQKDAELLAAQTLDEELWDKVHNLTFADVNDLAIQLSMPAREKLGLDDATGEVYIDNLKGNSTKYSFDMGFVETHYGQLAEAIAEKLGVTDKKSAQFRTIVEFADAYGEIMEGIDLNNKEAQKQSEEAFKIAWNKTRVEEAKETLAGLEDYYSYAYIDSLALGVNGLTASSPVDATGTREAVYDIAWGYLKDELKNYSIVPDELDVPRNASLENAPETTWRDSYYYMYEYAMVLSQKTGESVPDIIKRLSTAANSRYVANIEEEYNSRTERVIDQFNKSVYKVNDTIDSSATAKAPTISATSFSDIKKLRDAEESNFEYVYDPLTGNTLRQVKGQKSAKFSVNANPGWATLFEQYKITGDLNQAKLYAYENVSLTDAQKQELVDFDYKDLMEAFTQDATVVDTIIAEANGYKNTPNVANALYGMMANVAIEAYRSEKNVKDEINTALAEFSQNQTLVSLDTITRTNNKATGVDIGGGSFNAKYIGDLKEGIAGHTNDMFAQNGTKYLVEEFVLRENSQYSGQYDMSLVGLTSKNLFDSANIRNTLEIAIGSVFGSVPTLLSSDLSDKEYIETFENMFTGDDAIFSPGDMNVITNVQSEIIANQQDYLRIHTGDSLLGGTTDAVTSMYGGATTDSTGLKTKIEGDKIVAILDDNSTIDVTFMTKSSKYANALDNSLAVYVDYSGVMNPDIMLNWNVAESYWAEAEDRERFLKTAQAPGNNYKALNSRYQDEKDQLNSVAGTVLSATNGTVDIREENWEQQYKDYMANQIVNAGVPDEITREQEVFEKLIASGYEGDIPYLSITFNGKFPQVQVKFTNDKNVRPFDYGFDF